MSEGSPLTNGSVKSEEPGSTRLPGFHQAFGSTEIGRFSQPDGFFEAAVAAENERKVNMSPLPPPPPPSRRGRGSRGGRKARSRTDDQLAMARKESWQEWNPSFQPGCDSPMNSLQRMNGYPHREDQRPMYPTPDGYQPPQWHPDMPYYERQNCGQYYPPYYNHTPSQDSVRSYHDCYPPYDSPYPSPPPSWRSHPSHPYYHPNHFPHPPYQYTHYQQYSEYRQYSQFQSNRWAVNREIKYTSGLV